MTGLVGAVQGLRDCDAIGSRGDAVGRWRSGTAAEADADNASARSDIRQRTRTSLFRRTALTEVDGYSDRQPTAPIGELSCCHCRAVSGP